MISDKLKAIHVLACNFGCTLRYSKAVGNLKIVIILSATCIFFNLKLNHVNADTLVDCEDPECCAYALCAKEPACDVGPSVDQIEVIAGATFNDTSDVMLPFIDRVQYIFQANLQLDVNTSSIDER